VDNVAKKQDSVEEAVQDVVQEVVGTVEDNKDKVTLTPKKRRLCRYPGCTKVIKSQGHCQRHGARAKRCKVEGCDKQAQGTHDGMCKRHWKALNFPVAPAAKEELPPPPAGESVYDSILPQSISYRPASAKPRSNDDDDGEIVEPARVEPPLDQSPLLSSSDDLPMMPLVSYLRDGADKSAGWHRNGERRARGMFPASSLSQQLEPWERQLALVEILLLSGGTPFANFKDLAHAWGREKGFHSLLAASVCERRGEVERKKRSDAGRTMTPEQRQSFRDKLKRARSHKDGDDDEFNAPENSYADTKGTGNNPSTLEEIADAAAMGEGSEGAVPPSRAVNNSVIETESISV